MATKFRKVAPHICSIFTAIFPLHTHTHTHTHHTHTHNTHTHHTPTHTPQTHTHTHTHTPHTHTHTTHTHTHTHTEQKVPHRPLGKCDSSLWKLLRVSFLGPRICKWLLDFGKFVNPCQNIYPQIATQAKYVHQKSNADNAENADTWRILCQFSENYPYTKELH
jgi:hypothetical protein